MDYCTVYFLQADKNAEIICTNWFYKNMMRNIQYNACIFKLCMNVCSTCDFIVYACKNWCQRRNQASPLTHYLQTTEQHAFFSFDFFFVQRTATSCLFIILQFMTWSRFNISSGSRGRIIIFNYINDNMDNSKWLALWLVCLCISIVLCNQELLSMS